MNKVISISLDESIFNKLEELRGLVSRSGFIESILKKYLESKNGE
jgi:metal-responsive CopG/Arc/MetJ family transcriptional regulator